METKWKNNRFSSKSFFYIFFPFLHLGKNGKNIKTRFWKKIENCVQVQPSSPKNDPRKRAGGDGWVRRRGRQGVVGPVNVGAWGTLGCFWCGLRRRVRSWAVWALLRTSWSLSLALSLSLSLSLSDSFSVPSLLLALCLYSRLSLSLYLPVLDSPTNAAGIQKHCGLPPSHGLLPVGCGWQSASQPWLAAIRRKYVGLRAGSAAMIR